MLVQYHTCHSLHQNYQLVPSKILTNISFEYFRAGIRNLPFLSVVVCQGIEKEPTSLQTKFDYKVALKKQLCLWALKIQNYTWKKNASEPLRQASSDSIKIAGGQIVKWISKKLTKPKNIKYVSIFELFIRVTYIKGVILFNEITMLVDFG